MTRKKPNRNQKKNLLTTQPPAAFLNKSKTMYAAKMHFFFFAVS